MDHSCTESSGYLVILLFVNFLLHLFPLCCNAQLLLLVSANSTFVLGRMKTAAESKELHQEGMKCIRFTEQLAGLPSPATRIWSLAGFSPTNTSDGARWNAQPSQRHCYYGLNQHFCHSGVEECYSLSFFQNPFGLRRICDQWIYIKHTKKPSRAHKLRKTKRNKSNASTSSHTLSSWLQTLFLSKSPSCAPTWIFSPVVLSEVASALLLSPPAGVPTCLAVSLLSSVFLSPAFPQSSLALS